VVKTAHHFFIIICAASGSGGMEVNMKDNKDFRLSIFSWFGFVLPLPTRLKMIKDTGFYATTLWWEDEFGCPGIRKEDMPGMVRESGLILENIHVPYDNCDDFWSESRLNRDIIVNRHIAWVNDCACYNIPMMVMHISDTRAPSIPNSYGIDSIARILKIAEEFGIVIAIENTGRADYNQFVLSELESQYLGLCYDSSHDWLYSNNKGELLKETGNRLVAVHLSDNDGVKDRHWLPGEGNIDWEKVMSVFPQSSYNGYITLEVYPCPQDFERTPQNFLRKGYQRALWLKELLLSD